MGRRKKTNEVKIKVIESKIKNIKELGKEERLEEQLINKDKEEFEEFMSNGESRSPLIETGQASASGPIREIDQVERMATERQETTPAAGERGATVNPEFSVYEIAKRVAVRDTNERARLRYETGAHVGDAVMRRAVEAEPINEMTNVLDRRQRVDIGEPELQRLRDADESREEYESRINANEAKVERKRPWI